MRQLTSLDVQFLALEDGRALGHVGAIAVYDPRSAPGGMLDARRVRALVAERIHLLGPFRWRLVPVPLSLDYPYWVEDSAFDLEFHVRELALPPPGDDSQLAEQVARVFTRPLDRTRPLWELHVIHGLSDGSVGVLSKVHHAAVDGVSGAELVDILLDPSPAGRVIPAAPALPATTPPVPGAGRMLMRGVAGLPRQRLRAVGVLPRTLPHLDTVPTLRHLPGVATLAAAARGLSRMSPRSGDGSAVPGPRVTVPRTRFQSRISPHRRVAFGSLSLDEVKAIKNVTGATVNDVVMTICTGVLRDWLIARDELPIEPLVAMVPVSVRTPEQRGTFGNRVSNMIVQLPTNERDPVVRVRKVRESMLAAKERHQATPATLLQDANQFIPPALLARAARVTARVAVTEPFNAPVNVVISNVRGSAEPLYCAGATLKAQYPVSAIIDGVGLNITVLSYQDQLDFGFTADRSMLDDASELIDRLHNSLAELRAATDTHTGGPDINQPRMHPEGEPR